MAFAYSDGVEVESLILNLLRETTDLGSDTAIAANRYDNWPVHYHLSPERANLVRHLDFEGLDVLELGAGMGAVSRYLAEHARSLTVVEGSQARYDALSARLRDLTNWKGTVSNLQDYKTTERFDVVCLIGVLEYSGVYIDDSDPFSWVLHHAASLLKEDGVLVLAIENQQGIKYWAGAPEDHTSRMYDGICGYPSGRTPKTFTRKSLLDLLARSGFASVEAFYPWPDYKLPSVVVSEGLLKVAPSVAGEMASDAIEKGLVEGPRFFPDALAILELSRTGQHGDFANSFLFACSKQETSSILSKLLGCVHNRREVAWHYAVERKTGVSTVIRSSVDGLVSRKQPATGDGPSLEEPVLMEPRVSSLLARYAYFGEDKVFDGELTRFLKWSFERWDDGTGGLLPEALDAIATNAVVKSDGGYGLFDLEWKWHEPVRRSLFIMRNVFALRHAWQMSQNPRFGTLRDLYGHVCESTGVVAEYEKDLEDETTLHARVGTVQDSDFVKTAYRRQYEMPRIYARYARDPKLELLARKDMQELANRNREVEQELARLRIDNHNLNAELTRRGVRIALAADRALRKFPGIDPALRALARLRHRAG